MHVEVSVALNFVISYLYNKLPRRRVDMFGEEVEKGMKKKFEGHWYPEKPFKGSGYRCVRVSDEKVDPVLEVAAHNSGLDIEEIKDYLPKDLTVWVDPGEVSYRIGEKGVVKVVYSNKTQEGLEGFDKEIQAASKGFNPEAQCFKPIDSLSSSLSNLSLSPSSPGSPSNNSGGSFQSSTSPITSFLNRTNNTPMFTTASFAQTKFGSTKLKSQSKRPTRLSPTEFGGTFNGLKPAHAPQRGLPTVPQPPPQQTVAPQPPPAVAPHSLPQAPPTAVLPPPQQANFNAIPHNHARSRTLSPRDLPHAGRDLRQEYLEHQQRLLLAHHHQQQHQQQQQQQQQQQHLPHSQQHQQQQHQQQQQQQQHHPQHHHHVGATAAANLLSPVGGGSPLGGSLTDLYGTYQSALSHSGYSDLLGPGKNGLGLPHQGTPSPDGNKSFLDSVNLTTLPPYASLQHLLVAN